MRRPGIVIRGGVGVAALAVGVLVTFAATGPAPAQVLLRDFAGVAGHIRLVPAAAHTEGLEGTTWRTDLELHNPGVTEASGYLFFLRTGRDNSEAVGRSVSVGPGVSLRLADVVQRTFGEPRATGAILVGTDSELIVTSRTFNDDESGTYGQYVEGCAHADALATGDTARLIQLVQNAAFRTNLGIVNAGPTGFHADVDFSRGDGRRLGSRRYWVGPFMHVQDVEVLTRVTSDDVDDAYAVVGTGTPGARFFAYASVADNRTGDPTLVVPAQVSSEKPVYLPGAARVTGYAGTDWRTDLEVHNPEDTQARFTVAMLVRDEANTAPEQRSFSLDGGRSVRFADVLSSVFGVEDGRAATLRITPDVGGFAAVQRTYNDQPTGTYGQFVAAMPEDAAVAHGQTACIVQLSQSASESDGFRTNLGFVNSTRSPIAIIAELYRADGLLLGTRSYQLPAYGYRQEDRVFRRVTTDEVEDGYALVRTTTVGGRFLAYASVVDNSSGDPIAIPARLAGSPACSYAVTPTGRSHGAGAETGSFTIEAPAGCAWAATTSASWVQLTGGTSGSGNGTVSYRLEANPAASPRTATIEVSGAPTVGSSLTRAESAIFTVTQAGQECTYALDPTGRSHGSGEETGSFTVETPAGCTWTANATASWIRVTGGASGSGSGTVSYRLEANPGPAPRTHSIVVHGHAFTITQAGQDCSYALDPSGRTHGTGAETGSFTVTAPAGCTWTANATASWIEITGGASGSGNGTVSYRLEANTQAWTRSATILVHGLPFTVTQDGLECSCTLTPTGRSHGAGTETGSFTVTAPAGCAWNANSTAPWIGVTGGASGSGDGTVSYRVEANPGTSSRTGTILVRGLAFTVTQAGQACSYTLNPSGRTHGSGTETGSFTVATSAGCSWAANATASWIQVTGGATGTGGGTVSYRVEANPGTSSRTGTIVVHGVAFTITQSGQSCTYTLDPTGRTHGTMGGTASFAVATSAACTWTANATASWIQVTSGSSGTGSGTVTYRISANMGSSIRDGTISVQGATFRITQTAETVVSLPGGVPLVLVHIPGGTFQMGSPSTERGRYDNETRHQVTLTRDYYIGKYEVTQRQWLAVMGSNPSASCGNHGIGDDHPVYCVTWDDVCGGASGSSCSPTSFVGRLNAQLGTTTFRLPTEAEWEYAARAGTETEFSFPVPSGWAVWCDDIPEARPYMWWCVNSGAVTHPVGLKSANPWGLHDVHGNVLEWVADWSGAYPSTAVTDPTGPASGTEKIERGGSWMDWARFCRSAFRLDDPPTARFEDTGFRLARTP